MEGLLSRRLWGCAGLSTLGGGGGQVSIPGDSYVVPFGIVFQNPEKEDRS